MADRQDRGGGGNKRKGGPDGAGGGGGSGVVRKDGKKAKYYAPKGSSGQALPLGTHGILVTCDAGWEDKAGAEALVLIEEHYDNLAKEQQQEPAPGAAAASGAGAGAGGSKDIAALLAAEVAGLKDRKAARFKVHSTGVKGTVYIIFPQQQKQQKAQQQDQQVDEQEDQQPGAQQQTEEEEGGGDGVTADGAEAAAPKAEEVAKEDGDAGGAATATAATAAGEDEGEPPAAAPAAASATAAPAPALPTPLGPRPLEVVLSISKEASDKKQCRGRHCSRFLPVDATCFAGMEEIKAAAPGVVAPHFPGGDDAAPVDFAVEYEHRSTEGFDRLTVINCFTAAIKTPPHKVNLKEPSKTVLVQLTRNGCAMSVVTGYREYAKFNLRKLAEVDEEEAAAAGGGKKKQ